AGSLEVTLNTLLQGAWALLLSRYSGAREVVYGVTVAGRPAEVAGSQELVGLLINTLPTRVDVAASARLGAWLRDVQAQQVAGRQYEYTPLVEVQGWSG